MESIVELLEVAALVKSEWMLSAVALVFIMQAGFILLERGFVRRHEMESAARSLIGLATVTLFFWLIGFGLMFGTSVNGWGVVGWTLFAPDVVDPSLISGQSEAGPEVAILLVFQSLLCIIPLIIISNAALGRLRLEGYLLICLLISGLIYPLLGHWAWGGRLMGERVGWLATLGFVDLAGSSVLFSAGGWCSLALLIVLGPRVGRFSEDSLVYKRTDVQPTLLILGVLLLWIGWFGLISGSAMLLNRYYFGAIAVNLLLGGAAGTLAIIPLRIFQNGRKVETSYLIRGLLAGLVSISACAHALHPQATIIVSAVGAWSMLLLDWGMLKLKIDDAVGATPVFLGAGIWGSLAVAFYADQSLLNTGLSTIGQLGAQIIGVFATGGWSFLTTIICVGLLDLIFPFRVSLQEELDGQSELGASMELDLWDLTAEDSPPLPNLLLQPQASTEDST